MSYVKYTKSPFQSGRKKLCEGIKYCLGTHRLEVTARAPPSSGREIMWLSDTMDGFLRAMHAARSMLWVFQVLTQVFFPVVLCLE